MQIYCQGIAEIRHAETGEIHEIDCEDLDWGAVGGSERSMGAETHYEATIEHPELGLITWGLWEYPEGTEDTKKTDSGRHVIINDFDYGLEHEEPEPDDWLSYPPPSNPYEIFIESHNQAGRLLTEYGQTCGNSLLNRMVFSHQITALEAYLGDTLINEVMKNKAALLGIIDADDLKDKKFTLASIANSPNLVRETVQTVLRDILYHNLSKVNFLYKAAFNVDILTLTNKKPSLFRAIELRHDCVHRNGFDKEGNEHKIFTKNLVQETAEVIRNFVDSIEESIHPD